MFIFSVIFLAVLLVIGSSLPVYAQGVVLYGARYAGPDGPATLYSVNPATGAATTIGPIGFERCGGMDFDATGTLFATAERNDGSDTAVLITIDPKTGAGTEIGEIAINDTFFDVSFRNSDGILFTSIYGPHCVALGTINTETGMGTYIGDTITCDPGNAIAFSSTDILFHCDADDNGTIDTLDQVTGQATFVTPLIFPDSLTSPVVNAMDFHPNSGVLFATVKDNIGTPGHGDPKYLTTIDTETGVVTIVGQTETDLDAIAFAPFSPPPHVSDFSAVPTTGPTPLEVQFTDETVCDFTSWRWDFGDGGTSSEQNPVHIYTQPGPFTVSLTASGGSCQYITATRVDYIHPYTMGVGGEAYSVRKTGILAPWIIMFALISLGGAFTVKRRRYTC